MDKELKTEIDRLQALLEQKEEDGKKSHAFLKNLSIYNRQIIDNIPDPIIIISESMQILDANKATENFFKTYLTDILYTPFLDLFSTADEVRNFLLTMVQSKKEGKIKTKLQPKKNQEPISISLKANFCTDTQNNVSIILLINDLTEVERLIHDAEKANRAKSNFLANMSHEIRTPINSILGFTELLIDTKLNKEQLEFVSAVKQSGLNLLGLLNDILDLSKMETDRIHFRPTYFPFLTIIDDIKNTFLSLIKNKNLELKIDISTSLPDLLYIDEKRIRQIFLNLVSNAIKFTDSGEIHLHILTGSQTEKNVSLVCIVTDTGIGIPEEKQELLFKQFSQIETKISTEGSGLGLFITKQIVNGMGGKIDLFSEHGKGTTFSIFLPDLPFKNSKPSTPPKTNSIGIPSQKNPDSDPVILIVDDNELNRTLVSKLLRKNFTQQLMASNGEEAIQIALSHKPQIILMDMKMPVMDGYSATQFLKSHADTKHIPIIALTAHAFEEESTEIAKIGCDAFLTKPVQKSKLISTILNLL